MRISSSIDTLTVETAQALGARDRIDRKPPMYLRLSGVAHWAIIRGRYAHYLHGYRTQHATCDCPNKGVL